MFRIESFVPVATGTETFTNGDRAKGWIVFAAPTDGSVNEVRYSEPSDGTDAPNMVKWAI